MGKKDDETKAGAVGAAKVIEKPKKDDVKATDEVKKPEAEATDEEKKLAAAKEAAKGKVPEKKTPTVDTIKFKKGSGSGIVFEVLDKAKKPLTATEVTERAVKAGIKNPDRAVAVANWFAGNSIAIKNDKDCYSLVERTAPDAAEAKAAEKPKKPEAKVTEKPKKPETKVTEKPKKPEAAKSKDATVKTEKPKRDEAAKAA